MGRIKTSYIKHIAHDLFEKHTDKFSTDFIQNKDMLKQLMFFESKKMRNIVAGYITRMKRQSSKQP